MRAGSVRFSPAATTRGVDAQSGSHALGVLRSSAHPGDDALLSLAAPPAPPQAAGVGPRPPNVNSSFTSGSITRPIGTSDVQTNVVPGASCAASLSVFTIASTLMYCETSVNAMTAGRPTSKPFREMASTHESPD